MKNLNIKILVIAALVSTNALATTINDIEIKNLKQLPKEFVLQNIPVKVGEQYSNKNLSDIYLSLVNTGLVKDVRVLPKENKSTDTVKLIIDIDEIENAKNLLQNQLAIKEASKRTELKVNKFEIIGSKNVDISAIKEASRIKVGQFYTPITVNETAQAILNTGYFKEILPNVNVNAKKKTVDIILKVIENPIIKGVNLEGVTVFNVDKIKQIAGLEKGKVVNVFNFNPETSPIINLYRQNGLLTARIEKAEFSKDGIVNITVSEGKVSDIEYKKKIDLVDNKRLSSKKTKLKTKPYIFERMSHIKKGDLVTEAAINSTIKEYYKTGLYSSIEPRITGDPNNINDRKVTFLIEERPTTSINGQASYETKEGFTAGLTLSDKNFLGRQQEVSLSSNFGTRGNYEFSASFFDPWIKGTDRLQAGANLFFKRDKTKHKDLLKPYTVTNDKNENVELPYQLGNILRSSQSYTYGGSVTLGKGFKHNIFLSVKPKFYGVKAYNSEGITEKDKKGKTQAYIDYTLGAVVLGATYDTRDDAYIPKNGFFINGTAELGYIFKEKSLTNKFLNERKNSIIDFNDTMNKNDENDEIGKLIAQIKKETDVNKKKNLEKDLNEAIDKYIKDNKKFEGLSLNDVKDENRLKPRPYYIFNVDARAYHKVIKDKNSMAYRLLLGYASKGTPENMLFHTSDGTILRGYSDTTASILATATIENRTYINDYVQFVLFADAGIHNKPIGFYNEGKYNGLPKYESFKEMFAKDKFKEHLKADLGLGLRLTTPLGVIRLDYAWPLINKEKTSNPRKGFDLGGKLSFGFGQTF